MSMYGADAFGEVAYGEHTYAPLDTSAFEAFLAEAESERCWLLEIDAFSLAASDAAGAGYGDAGYGELGFGDASAGVTGGTVPQRFSTHGFISQADDTPARTFYEPCLNADVTVDRRVMGRDGIGGLTQVYAEVRLINRAGALDLLTRNYAVDGRRAQVLIGRQADARAAFGVLFTGVVETVGIGMDVVTIKLSDGSKKLDVPINATTYAGTGGLEGGADLKGKPKPLAFGHVFNVSPQLVDSVNLIYQVNDGAIYDVPNAWDRGIALSKVVGAPAAGEYSVDTAAGTITLGATPAGTVTCDVQGDASGSGYVSRTADIVLRILVNKASLYSTEIEPVSFSTLNADAPAEVGIWIGAEDRTCAAAIDELLFGVGAFGGFNRQGAFNVGVVAAASGTPAATYTAQEITGVDRDPLPPVVEPVAWRALVGWQKNYTPQEDLAAGVTAARRTFAAEAWRVSKHEDASVKSRHILALELGLIEALYAQEADADTEAARLFDLWSAGRAPYRVRTKLQALTRDVGQVVVVQHPRFGFAAGISARVLGHRVRGTDVELTVLA